MPKTILITGGAGFIGSHLADLLLEHGYGVRLFDNLEPQIHPNGKPSYLNPAAAFIEGDVRDRAALAKAMDGVDAIFHFAAAVGTGQSMYQVEKYTAVNVGGLANLLDILVETKQRPHVIFPGSATSYGECAHTCPEHGLTFPDLRPVAQLERKQWDIPCPECGRVMTPVPIPESQPLRPKFVYGVNKKACEELLTTVAETYGIPYTILRFFNVYGPRQSLSNPYTGVIAIFASRIKNSKPPVVIEDGKEFRDFISVFDIAQACRATLENEKAIGHVLNVGTGQPTDILSLAQHLIELHGSKLVPEINGEFRKSDFRYSLADTTKIRALLGWQPTTTVTEGLRQWYEWSKHEDAVDNFDRAYAEMKERGIVGGTAEPKVAVVTLNWNGLENTVECVEALLASTHKNLKIIVVDNASKNRDADRLEERFGGKIEVIRNTRNEGVAGGNNTGLRRALADREVQYVLMMNNDLMVTPTTVAHLVAPAEMNKGLGMVASRMMNYFDREKVDNLGIMFTTSGLGYNRKTEWYPLFCPCSGCGLYRADALRKIAMPNGDIWDNDFFAYVDDPDAGFRIQLAGYGAAYAPDAVAYHKEGESSGGAASDFSIYHGHRNNLWLIVKDFPTATLARYFFSILATQIGTIALYAGRHRLRLILRAKLHALAGLPKMLRKRRSVQALRTVSATAIERLLVRRVYIDPKKT